LGVSERRACRVLGQPRAVQRYTPQVREDEAALTGRIVELAAVYGRYGTPRIAAMLQHEGWRVNHKRVERIWRQAGLKVPQKQPRRGRLHLILLKQIGDRFPLGDFGRPSLDAVHEQNTFPCASLS
jgi:putative transposase